MLRGGEGRQKFEKSLETLKIGVREARGKYFAMEEQVTKFLTVGDIGARPGA